MIYAENGIIPSSYWIHNSSIQNNDGWSVAMYLGLNKIVPLE